MNRRDFLTHSACSAGVLASLGHIGRALAATDVSGYKALVCVYLAGGNNAFNWLVPTSDAAYASYRSSRSNLALAQSSLLALNGSGSDGNGYGLHASCPELRTLFNNGRAAFLGNVGTLVQPTTPAQARSGSLKLPTQLFSHSDQTTAWMTSIADGSERYGWAGRIADLYDAQGTRANLAFNLSIGASNYWQEGRNTIPYALGTNGAPVLGVTQNRDWRGGTRQQAALALRAQAAASSQVLVAEHAAILDNAADKVTLVNDAYNAAGDVSTSFPVTAGDSNLGAQLHAVARTIKARAQIGDARQLFFVQIGGFDTHNNELAVQGNLLRYLSQNLNAFWSALGEIGQQNNVTVFTASDFARSLGSNGDGSDHGWGSHHLVLGGAVRGGKLYGTMPSLVVNGADDFGAGRIVPTTSTDQYAATLARWFGLGDAELDSVFPNLKNFPVRNLGFLG